MKKTVTQEDLDLNPELEEQGITVGDEIDIPEKEEDGKTEDGPGPGAPPPPPPPPTKP